MWIPQYWGLGGGVKSVGKKLALVEALVALVTKGFWHKKGSTKIKVPAQKKYFGGNEWAGPPNAGKYDNGMCMYL
jgi:hypothetical protein